MLPSHVLIHSDNRLVQLVPCVVLMSLLPLIPELPRWLVMHDRMDEAQTALARYLGDDLSLDDPEVLRELGSIEEAYKLEKQSAISFKEVVMCRDRSRHLHRLLLGCGGQFMQQFGGINALNYYFPIILTENIGLSELMARILTGCSMSNSALKLSLILEARSRAVVLSSFILQHVIIIP